MVSESFGNYLRGLRKGKRMTVRKLEELSGVSASYITNVENKKRGIPSPDILKKIAKPLGVPYAELMEMAGYIDTQTKLAWLKQRYISEDAQALIDRVYLSINELKTKYPKEVSRIDSFMQLFKECVNNPESQLINSYNLALRGEETKQANFGTEEEIQKLELLLVRLSSIFEHDEEKAYIPAHDYELVDGYAATIQSMNKHELNTILFDSLLTLNGHLLTIQDRQRALEMLNLLFPEYQPSNQR